MLICRRWGMLSVQVKEDLSAPVGTPDNLKGPKGAPSPACRGSAGPVELTAASPEVRGLEHGGCSEMTLVLCCTQQLVLCQLHKLAASKLPALQAAPASIPITSSVRLCLVCQAARHEHVQSTTYLLAATPCLLLLLHRMLEVLPGQEQGRQQRRRRQQQQQHQAVLRTTPHAVPCSCRAVAAGRLQQQQQWALPAGQAALSPAMQHSAAGATAAQCLHRTSPAPQVHHSPHWCSR
jgi:hypothetical protein